MQPCSQPRYGLIERSNEMSGESLRVMILRVASAVTVVLNGGSCSRPCQPSSKATRATGSYRPEAFEAVPRPRRRSRSTPAPWGRGSWTPPPISPAGVEGSGAGGRFNAEERLIVTAPGRKLTRELEQNKNNYS